MMTADDLDFEVRSHAGGTVLPPHRHEVPHLVAVLGGAFDDVSGATTRGCQASTVILRAGGEEHENRFRASRSDYVSVVVPLELRDALPRETVLTQHAATARMARALRRGDTLKRRVVGAALMQILTDLAKRWRIRRVRLLIEERLSESVRIGDLALEVGIDPFALVRGFRRAYHRTPSQFLIEARVRRACEELRRSARWPLADIAIACGFYDQSHMTNAFRRVRGVAPLEFADRR